MVERGKYIVFEGNDGAGKSTQVELLCDYLTKAGFELFKTKEPGGIPETMPIRDLILGPRGAEDPILQLIGFNFDRRVNLQEVEKSLVEGKMVVQDRSFVGTRIYQSEHGIEMNDILYLENLVLNMNNKWMDPDIIILIDVNPEVGMSRRVVGKEELNYFDKDKLEVQTKRREMYLKMAEELEMEVVDGNKTEEEVFAKIIKVLQKKGILS
ncbi:dTMP kinase [Candidatus Microgenomates bacterium]|nr:dTMP kinase [Candidatus Microgenomates bacterium]